MKVSQAEIARKWGVSRGIVSRYVARGMPLSNLGAAESWLSRTVPFGKCALGIGEARHGPICLELETRDPREGDPNWRLTVEETIDVMIALRTMKTEGCHREKHPRHQAFCDGLRLARERGLSLTPEQWKRVRSES